MDDQLPPLLLAHRELGPAARERGRWLRSSRTAVCLLIHALLAFAIRVGRAMPVSELSYVLAADAVWFLGAESTTMLDVERDLRPLGRRALPHDWGGCANDGESAATPTTFACAIEPPDVSAVIGRLVYPGCPGAIVRFEAQMLGTGLMAAYPWSREHGWAARN
jgi:hypothetical protein